MEQRIESKRLKKLERDRKKIEEAGKKALKKSSIGKQCFCEIANHTGLQAEDNMLSRAQGETDDKTNEDGDLDEDEEDEETEEEMLRLK